MLLRHSFRENKGEFFSQLSYSRTRKAPTIFVPSIWIAQTSQNINEDFFGMLMMARSRGLLVSCVNFFIFYSLKKSMFCYLLIMHNANHTIMAVLFHLPYPGW